MSTSKLLSERFDWPDGSYMDQDDNPRDVVLVGDWTQIAACHWRGPAGTEVYIPEGVRFVVTGTALWEVDSTWAQHPAAILHTSEQRMAIAEPPEGWRWIDGVLVHRDGRVATIGAFGMACHRRGSDESAMLPLDVARYLLAWRERGEPCPDCDGTGWASESNPGTGQGGRDEQLAVPCPRGCPDAE